MLFAAERRKGLHRVLVVKTLARVSLEKFRVSQAPKGRRFLGAEA